MQQIHNAQSRQLFFAIVCVKPKHLSSSVWVVSEQLWGQLFSRNNLKVRRRLSHFDIRAIISERTEKTLKRAQGRHPKKKKSGKDGERRRQRESAKDGPWKSPWNITNQNKFHSLRHLFIGTKLTGEDPSQSICTVVRSASGPRPLGSMCGMIIRFCVADSMPSDSCEWLAGIESMRTLCF